MDLGADVAKQVDNGMKQVGFWALVSMTLGLAPFTPEPHIWGKLRWVAGGAQGMALMDVLDLIMHGFPWVMLVVAAVKLAITKARPANMKAKAD